MALIDNCIFWSKLGTNGEITTVEIGANGVITGVLTFAAGKFGNGVFGASAVAYPTFPIGNTSPQAGLMDFWWKPAYNSLSAANAGIVVSSLAERLFIWWHGGEKTIRVYTWEAGYFASYRFTPTAFNANDLIHIMILWNSIGGAGDKLRLWQNTAEKAEGILTDAAWTYGNIDIDLQDYFGGSNAVIDNLKLYDAIDAGTIAAVLANRNTEGFPVAREPTKVRIYAVPDYVPVAPVPTLFAPIRPVVQVIGSVDIYNLKLVDAIGNITESRSFRKDKLIDNEIRIPVDNKALDFSPENPVSFFNGTDWFFSQVKIWNKDNIKIWDGKLWNIVRDSNTRGAFLVSRSIMSKIKKIKVVYTSSDWETGPAALINIFAAADPPITEYNQKTFQDSINTLTAAGALLKLEIAAEDNVPLQSCIEQVAEYCAADAYSHLGEIYFKVWVKITGSGAVAIGKKNVLKQPITQSAPEEIINNFSIGYSGDEGIPATDENNGNIGGTSRSRYGLRSLPEFSTGDENLITFKDLITAVWIGEQYIRRTHRNIETIPRPLIQSKYSVEGSLQNYIDLEAIIGFSYPDEGFDNEVMEVFRFMRNDDKNIVDITSYTRAS